MYICDKSIPVRQYEVIFPDKEDSFLGEKTTANSLLRHMAMNKL